ncbi:MAG: 2-oxoacid:ferredoxin oxidoreductase subunit beta [Ignavibacteriae bacterium]|nr:2-oxoacid:ferredoxin oxidoreductase subunit beta [Ignavibacteriota bacterium]MCB9216419.1 2-oxoacid:ferredoxin oxidoreductase subunit beta [Ignavibacteria bacterium]
MNSIEQNGLNVIADKPEYTAKDFSSDADVRWCPGCGDYSILAQVQRTLPRLDRKKEEYAFISGIGCSSRFPYYMNCYGFHTIHGRAPAFVTGLKVTRPDLSVWMVTGDGDGLSIGGNHMMHILRRNINCNILLFNNRIYGLTKGQYSPTSEVGKKTKSTPFGSIDTPVNPVRFALGCGASYVARTIDREPKHQQEIYEDAYNHQGTSFIEIYQNCNIFNDGAFSQLTERDVKDDNVLPLKHGEPMIFGKESDKGIRLNGLRLEVVSLSDTSVEELLKHDESSQELAHTLALMIDRPGMPTPIGVIYREERSTYDDLANGQVETAIERFGEGDLEKLLHEGETWVVA